MDFLLNNKELLNQYFDRLYLNSQFTRSLVEKDENTPASDQRPQELKDLPDSFERTGEVPEWATQTVFCYDPKGSSILKQFITRNSSYLQRRMTRRGWSFLYLQELDSQPAEHFEKILRYYFPALPKLLAEGRTEPAEFRYLASQNRLLETYLGISGITRPCLIRQEKIWQADFTSTTASDKPRHNRVTTWSVFYLPENESQLDNALKFYLYKPPVNSGVSFSLSRRKKDCDHQGEPIRISPGVYEEIRELLGMHGHSGAIELIGRILTELKNTHSVQDTRLLKIAEILAAESDKRLSKLVIRKNGELYLEDYNITLDLTPLQKTVYLFFLRHPEGILFKDLAGFRPELESIYRKLSNRTSPATIKASLDDLVNPFHNSMSEKCSRIKEAFLRLFRKDLAEHYYVSGGRLTRKQILLDRKLVVFEDPDFTSTGTPR